MIDTTEKKSLTAYRKYVNWLNSHKNKDEADCVSGLKRFALQSGVSVADMLKQKQMVQPVEHCSAKKYLPNLSND